MSAPSCSPLLTRSPAAHCTGDGGAGGASGGSGGGGAGGGDAPPLDFLLEGCPRLREVTLTQFAAWSSQSLAHLKAFEAKLLARNRKAKVAY